MGFQHALEVVDVALNGFPHDAGHDEFHRFEETGHLEFQAEAKARAVGDWLECIGLRWPEWPSGQLDDLLLVRLVLDDRPGRLHPAQEAFHLPEGGARADRPCRRALNLHDFLPPSRIVLHGGDEPKDFFDRSVNHDAFFDGDHLRPPFIYLSSICRPAGVAVPILA